tara:strand:- start:15592 stop:17310 length:1719 start_codon:yes stop_codon:yes gene_type:complete
MNQPITILLVFLALSCNNEKKNQPATINDLADRFYEETLITYPEQSYLNDIPLKDHSLVGTNSLSDVKKWEDFEDQLYLDLQTIDETSISEKSNRITYWLLKEQLESSIGMRVCKRNLWNVNQETGIHQIWTYLADFQPVENDTLKRQAFERWHKLPAILQTEMDNLTIGIAQGYTMPKEIVIIVIKQLQTLGDYPLQDSPFMSPAKRSEDEAFADQWKDLVTITVLPAFKQYQNFLETEYLPKARENVSILANPNDADCYQAFIRSMTTTNKTGDELFALGSKIVAANTLKIQELGKELYQSNDFSEIINRIKSDSTNYFKSSEEILAYNNNIMNEAKMKSAAWFAVLPSTEVIIKPYLPHESGVGSYEAATGDKPAYYRINLSDPTQQTFYGNETLSFHEAYPGHHLQVGIEKDIKGMHPIRNLMWFGSYGEGWARYSEQLSEEMGLYKHKASLISRRAWPSRGLVMDPGLHLKKWSKEKLISYMMEAGIEESMALNLYQRSIVMPAQLTSYDTGGEEIKALRLLAENQLGDAFNIKEFHTKILENGSIPILALRAVIEDWIALKRQAIH